MTSYAPSTYVFTVDAVGQDEPVIAQSDCMEIQVVEDAGGATANYTVRRPFRTSPAVTVLGGVPYTFKNGGSGFTKGSIAGYVALLSGSASFAQMES